MELSWTLKVSTDFFRSIILSLMRIKYNTFSPSSRRIARENTSLYMELSRTLRVSTDFCMKVVWWALWTCNHYGEYIEWVKIRRAAKCRAWCSAGLINESPRSEFNRNHFSLRRYASQWWTLAPVASRKLSCRACCMLFLAVSTGQAQENDAADGTRGCSGMVLSRR